MNDAKRNRTAFLVLLALSHGPKHGYELSKFIEAKSNGFFRVPFGSLYPVLHKLESEKSISASWSETGSQKPKKTYSILPKGKKALSEEVELFKSFSTALSLLAPEGL